MPDGHPFISSRRAGFGLAGLMLLAIAGCSNQAARLSALDLPAQEGPVAPAGLNSLKASLAETFDSLKPRAVEAAKASPPEAHVVPASDPLAPKPEINEESAWCTSMRERALADSSILRAPRLAGSYDSDGKEELALSLHYSDFRKANLVEQRAEAECRKFMAQRGLQKLVATAPQNLTSAGFRAKADTIDAERVELERLRQNVVAAMAVGNINHEKATALLMLIEQLRADGLAARSQADRRIDDHGKFEGSAERLGHELLAAEHELDAIDSATRTADNVDVDVQAGYNQYAFGPPVGASTISQGFGGKVSFSMKLGVINPRRFEHERLASEAKDRAIRNEDGGPIWQAEELRRNQQRAIAALEESSRRIDKAMAEARKLLSALSDVGQPEFEGARFNARYQLLKMRADKAAITGSLVEIRSNLKHLDNG